jgi:hypothetical protein
LVDNYSKKIIKKAEKTFLQVSSSDKSSVIVLALLDSAADISLIHQDFVSQHEISTIKLDKPVAVRGFFSTEVYWVDTAVETKFFINGKENLISKKLYGLWK